MQKKEIESTLILEYSKELIQRISYVLLSFIICFIIAFLFKETLLFTLIKPLYTLILSKKDSLETINTFNITFLDLTEIFNCEIKLSFLFSLFLTLPYFWYQIWSFISPAYHFSQNIIFIFIITFSWLLIICAILFSLEWLLPNIWNFFINFSKSSYHYPYSLEFLPTVTPYIQRTLTIIIFTTISFQCPIFLFLLVHWKWVDEKKLISKRPWILLITLSFSALITPPDVVSQIILTIPIIISYEISLFLILIKNYIKCHLKKDYQ